MFAINYVRQDKDEKVPTSDALKDCVCESVHHKGQINNRTCI